MNNTKRKSDQISGSNTQLIDPYKRQRIDTNGSNTNPSNPRPIGHLVPSNSHRIWEVTLPKLPQNLLRHISGFLDNKTDFLNLCLASRQVKQIVSSNRKFYIGIDLDNYNAILQLKFALSYPFYLKVFNDPTQYLNEDALEDFLDSIKINSPNRHVLSFLQFIQISDKYPLDLIGRIFKAAIRYTIPLHFISEVTTLSTFLKFLRKEYSEEEQKKIKNLIQSITTSKHLSQESVIKICKEFPSLKLLKITCDYSGTDTMADFSKLTTEHLKILHYTQSGGFFTFPDEVTIFNEIDISIHPGKNNAPLSLYSSLKSLRMSLPPESAKGVFFSLNIFPSLKILNLTAEDCIFNLTNMDLQHLVTLNVTKSKNIKLLLPEMLPSLVEIFSNDQQEILLPPNANIRQLLTSSLLTVVQTSPNSPPAVKKESPDNIKKRINDYYNNGASIQDQDMLRSSTYIENNLVINLNKYLKSHCELFPHYLEITYITNTVEKPVSTN